VVAGDEQLWASEADAREAPLQCVTVGDGGVADQHQHVAARLIQAVDEFVGDQARRRMVVMEVGRRDQTHGDMKALRCCRVYSIHVTPPVDVRPGLACDDFSARL
jgi:hypothetical protein